jgi:Polyketide cyclase / dehydrase and lipid transport
MISMTQTTRIPAAPERVWRFFSELDEHYSAWHPEHLAWRTLRGEPLAKGTVWFADEWVGPLRVSSRFFVEDAEPERFFAYRVGFPASVLRAGGSFRLVPVSDDVCELIEEVHLGYPTRIFGALADRVLTIVLPLKEFRRHIREEGENLARLLERSGAGDEH